MDVGIADYAWSIHLPVHPWTSPYRHPWLLKAYRPSVGIKKAYLFPNKLFYFIFLDFSYI